MAFTVDQIELSMKNHETGNAVFANVYKVDGISRTLSIAELVMSICLKRATELEAQIITKMETMAKTTNNLEEATRLQEAIVALQPDDNDAVFSDVASGLSSKINTISWYRRKTDAEGGGFAPSTISVVVNDYATAYAFITREDTDTLGGLGVKKDNLKSDATVSEVIQAMSSQLDSLNTQSQKETIELQSLTNKRDQSYDLITNMLKSMNTILSGIASNFSR